MTRPAPGETSSEFAREVYSAGVRRLRARSASDRRSIDDRPKGIFRTGRMPNDERRKDHLLAISITALVLEVERLQAIVSANKREEK